MRQLTCTGPGTIAWREVDAPRRQADDDALVRPLAVARCDIDPFLVSGLLPAPGPFALGHEAIVEIVESCEPGDGPGDLRVGQRAAVAFQVSCGTCRPCTSGHSAVCDAYPMLSDYGMMPLSGTEYGGMLSDLVRVPHARTMLAPIPDHLDPVAIASLCDNVMDGYRSVAPHLRARPGAPVLVVSHRPSSSIGLYAVQAALALGAERVDLASDDRPTLELAEKLGARPIETDFSRRAERYPIVVDNGLREEGLAYALDSTENEGLCQSVSFYAGRPTLPLPLGKMYTRGVQLHIGRAQSASMLPEMVDLVASGRLRPEEVTTRVVDWEEAPEAYLEPTIKLVVARGAA